MTGRVVAAVGRQSVNNLPQRATRAAFFFPRVRGSASKASSTIPLLQAFRSDESLPLMPVARTKTLRETTPSSRKATRTVTVPTDVEDARLEVNGREVRLTNLRKPFWPELGITKGDLLRYYAEITPYLLPHLIDR